jgi:hypothetical protein
MLSQRVTQSAADRATKLGQSLFHTPRRITSLRAQSERCALNTPYGVTFP